MRSSLVLACVLVGLLAACDAQRAQGSASLRQGHGADAHAPEHAPEPIHNEEAHTEPDTAEEDPHAMPMHGTHGEALAAGGAGHSVSAPPAPVVEEKKGFSGMYFGILTGFVILWTIYLFLYFFEYGGAGDYTFFLSSYITLFVLISLGLSAYFTPSILTGLLVSSLFIIIAASGFGVMATISSPDRFEGDKHNMGRTRLE